MDTRLSLFWDSTFSNHRIMQLIKVLALVFFSWSIGIVLLSCSDDTEKEVIIPKICVYKLAPTCTNGMGCGPRRTFELCDDKINAYQYTGSTLYEIEECNCN